MPTCFRNKRAKRGEREKALSTAEEKGIKNCTSTKWKKRQVEVYENNRTGEGARESKGTSEKIQHTIILRRFSI